MLSYLIHLIADEHQPMHCESFYTAAMPNGDRGGNDVYVKPAGRLPSGTPQGVRLHGLWDSLLGSALNPRQLAADTARTRTEAASRRCGLGQSTNPPTHTHRLRIVHPEVLAVCTVAVCKDSYSSREGIFVWARFAYARCTALELCPRFSIANRSG